MAQKAKAPGESPQPDRNDDALAVLFEPVSVTLIVHNFVDELSSVSGDPKKRQTILAVENGMTAHPPPPHGRAYVKDGALQIKPGGVTLRFYIRDEDKGGHTYFPIGIAFRQKDGAPPTDRATLSQVKRYLGHDVFKRDQIRWTDSYLQVTDSFKDCGNRPEDKYKFSVIIQRAHDGAIGIIDLPIGHDY